MSQLVISKMGIFHTPKSADEIVEWINRHAPEERAHLMTVMGMTWNFLAQAVTDHNTYGGDAVSTGDEA